MRKVLYVMLMASIFAGALSMSCLAQTVKVDFLRSPSQRNLFLRLSNPITITAEGIDISTLEITNSNPSVTIEKTDIPGQFILKANATGKNIITISAKVNGQTKKLFTEAIKVRDLPDPVAEIAGKYEGKISKSEVIEAGGLSWCWVGNKAWLDDGSGKLKEIWVEKSDLVMDVKITNFVINDMPNSTENSDRFSDKQIEYIKTLPAGSKLVIENIKAWGEDNVLRDLGTLVLRVTE